MSNNLFALGAAALSIFIAGPALAGDLGGGNDGRGPSLEERQQTPSAVNHQVAYGYPSNEATASERQSFTLVYLSELNRNEKAPIRQVSAEKVRAAQALASQDAALVKTLNARGVRIKDIIGTAKAFNGRTIYYVR